VAGGVGRAQLLELLCHPVQQGADQRPRLEIETALGTLGELGGQGAGGAAVARRGCTLADPGAAFR
jgi:hypothetical protein